jgi:ankyrin repeat protein
VVRGNGELESLCIQSAQLLIEHGAKIDGIGDGHPALTEAVELNAPRFIELFLGKGANINVVDGVGLTPLLEAISRYALESDCLRKHASPCDHMPTIELLLQRGADPNFRNADKWSELFDDHFPDLTGYTALGLCARYGWYDLAKLLLEHGADPTIPRNDGSLPVTIATAHQHAKVAALIGRYTGSNHSR